MRENPPFALEDVAEIRRLVDGNPWATIVSGTGAGLVASHYPVLLDPDRDDLTLLTHVGRPDERIHELGQRDGADGEVLVIVQGPHGYVSPGWYDADPAVPTWNHISAHLTCRVEILSAEENLRVLGQLVDRFEDRMPEPRRMEGTAADAAYAARISAGTVGLRLSPRGSSPRPSSARTSRRTWSSACSTSSSTARSTRTRRSPRRCGVPGT